jgi:UDP-N-acetylmuramoyl-L-alanine---L-glutamate ligase
VTGFADLAGKRVGIFGYGLEGRAAAARVAGLAAALVLVDDAEGRGEDVLVANRGGHEALLGCDVVLKSPGVPRRRGDVADLEAHGVRVTSALNLWLQDADRSRVIAVTGTKGKSTTTALITFLLRSLGESASSAGNIGRPPYDPDGSDEPGWWVLEVSSFQAVDLEVSPARVVITSLGSDHLDWHGSHAQYVEDKLALTRRPGAQRTFIPPSDDLAAVADRLGGEVVVVRDSGLPLATDLHLLGYHNFRNVALALAVVADATGRPIDEVAAAGRAHAREFTPLPGRFTLAAIEGEGTHAVRYVDDGLATSVSPTLAALGVIDDDDPLALIAGGFDRGVDYQPLAAALGARAGATTVVTLGPAGKRIAAALVSDAPGVSVRRAASMREAVGLARAALGDVGVVLFSPAAPSFDQYANWQERSADFTAVARTTASRSLGRDSNP